MSAARAAPETAGLSGDEGGAILLFDGVCNLCSGTVRFVLARDCRHRIRFASLQSSVARDLLGRAGVPLDRLDTLVLLDGGSVYVRSDAALRIAGKLCRAWPLLRAFWIVPRPLRDLVYDWIARNRYRWFGRTDACWIPEAPVRDRFLDADEAPEAPGSG